MCAFTNCGESTDNNIVIAQNKEDILPVVTLSIALYVLRRSMSARDGNFVIGFININKYTSASEKCTPLSQNGQLGHISVATGRIPSLFCAVSTEMIKADTIVARRI